MLKISACILGVFAIENNRIKDYILFKKDPRDIAEKLNKFEKGESFEELDRIKQKMKGEFSVERDDEYLRGNFRKIALDLKFAKDQTELNSLITSVEIERSKLKISKIEKRDKLIIQAVSALNDLDRILNVMTERIREWYGLHYPESNITSHEKFLESIMKHGKREGFENFKESFGMDLNEDDIKIIKEYASELKNIYEIRKKLEQYLEKVAPKEIPNLNAFLGSLLASRLLALAGSLEKLAKMPSSTIQLLGAEKSLFKFLKGREFKNPPKYGLIFTHPDVNSAKEEVRGKIARFLSAKLTLAARADFYTKKDISKELLENYRRKLKEIK